MLHFAYRDNSFADTLIRYGLLSALSPLSAQPYITSLITQTIIPVDD